MKYQLHRSALGGYTYRSIWIRRTEFDGSPWSVAFPGDLGSHFFRTIFGAIAAIDLHLDS